MKTALALVLLAGCGSSPGPKTPVENHGDPTAKPVAKPTGRGTARVIERSGTGGVIELDGERLEAMTGANREMEAHCGPDNYAIVQEGEEAVAAGDGTVGRTAVAWRVHYTCSGP